MPGTVGRYFEKKEFLNITELCHMMKKKDCDKGLGFHNYSTFYHALFSPIRDKEVRLLEIGHCKKGVSLPVWREYFSKATIIGVDCEEIEDDSEGILRYVFNQKSVEDIRRVMDSIQPVDIIIDDGIHNFDDNWNLFTHVFPYLSEGGIYIVEDLKSETRDEFLKRRHDLLKRNDVSTFQLLDIPYQKNEYDNRLLVLQKKKKPDLTIVTAASQNHSKSLIQFLCSLIVNKVVFKQVYVYDLGLDPATLRIIKDMFSEKQVRIRTFDYTKYPSYFNIDDECGQYAWKPVIIEEVAHDVKDGLLFWCDAGNKIVDDLMPLYDFMGKNYIFTPVSLGSIVDRTHPATMEYLSIQPDSSIAKLSMRNAAQVCFHIHEKTLQFIEEWSNCAQIKNCIAPDGSNRLNHRQDQSILSILFYQFSKLYPKLLTEIRDSYFVSIHQDID